MKQAVRLRQVGGFAVVDLSGRITVREDLSQIHERVHKFSSEGKKAVLLNLAQVSYADSNGLEELLECHKVAREFGVKLMLVDPSQRIRQLLKITKIDTLVEVYASEHDAIESVLKSGTPGSKGQAAGGG